MITLLSKKIELCPELNKECPMISKERDSRVKELEERLKQTDDEQAENLKLHNVHNKKVYDLGAEPPIPAININQFATNINKLEDLKNETEKKESERDAKLEAILKEMGEKQKEKVSTELEIDKLEKTIGEDNTELPTLKIKRASEEMNLSTERDMYNKNLSNLAVAESTKKEHDKDTADVVAKKKKIVTIDGDTEALKMLKEAFSPTGIKAIVIDYMIPRLEDRINEILKLLSDFTIRLDTQRKGVKEDTIKEGLFIDIFNEKGDCLDFATYSGGEKLKIIVAISEALSELQNVGFRILDEIFTGLDEESTEKFAEVMDALQSRFSQMLCISHLRNIKDLFDNKLIVAKKDGTSLVCK